MGLACGPPGYVVFGKHTLPQVAHAFKNVQSPVQRHHTKFLPDGL